MKDTKVSPISETISKDGCSIKVSTPDNSVEDAEVSLTSQDTALASLSKLEETVKEQKLETDNQKIKVEEMRASIKSLERTVGFLSSGGEYLLLPRLFFFTGDQEKAGIIFDAVFQTNLVTKPSANTKEDSNIVVESPEEKKPNVKNESPAKANSVLVTKSPAKASTVLVPKSPAKTNSSVLSKAPGNGSTITSLATKSAATHVVTVEPK